MPTKVFISWSGDLSKKIAEELRNWLPAVLQSVKPYFSDDDIDKGTIWNREIFKELEDTNIGLICLTPDNVDKPWINFEAGSLSKSFDKSKICTLLFSLEPSALKGPLTSFQCTKFVKEEYRKLIETINDCATDYKLESKTLDMAFESMWPLFEKKITTKISSHKSADKIEKRPDRDILEEILELSRMRYSRSTLPKGVMQRTFAEIFRAMLELMSLCGKEKENEIQKIMNSIEIPLKILSKEMNVEYHNILFSAGNRLHLFLLGEDDLEARDIDSDGPGLDY